MNDASNTGTEEFRMKLQSFLRRLAAKSPLADIPMTVHQGPAKGVRWTLFPFSTYWRTGGDTEVAAAASLLPHVLGSVFWDFGAHFGIHTVGMALKIGPTGEVAAFEPDPFSFAKLSRHVKLNHLHNVRLFPAAVSNQCGSGEMISYGDGSPTQHFPYPDDGGLRNHDQPFLVARTVRADDLVTNKKIRLPDLIKVDVEGHGGYALQGASNSIAERRPIIMVSSHSKMETVGVRDVLEALGYTVHAIDGTALDWDELTYHTRILLPS